MKGIWTYRFKMGDGGVLEADLIRLRTAPYVQVQTDLYGIHAPVRIAVGTFRSVQEAVSTVRARVKRLGVVLEETAIPLRSCEPVEAGMLFGATRYHLGLWAEVARPFVEPIEATTDWSDVAEIVSAAMTPRLRRTANAAVVSAHTVLTDVVERLIDILIWERRQQRVLLLEPTGKARRSYTRSTFKIVAGLETLKHLSRDYTPCAPPEELTSGEPAQVIDFGAWKRARHSVG